MKFDRTAELLVTFEKALRQGNPILADRLQAGLPEPRMRRMLDRAKVQGDIGPILVLFGWKNGSRLDPSVAQHASPFPGSEYIFMDLEMMTADFRGFYECATHHPRYAKIAGKYFPMFWNGSNDWLAVDLDPRNQTRVVLLETESEGMLRKAYGSFDALLEDAIRANEMKQTLTCLM